MKPTLKLTIVTTGQPKEINYARLQAVLEEIQALKARRPELFKVSPGPGESLPVNDTTNSFS